MTSSEERTFRLPVEHSRYIDALVAAGAYATASEVVDAGLRALQELEAEIERWLIDEVAPAYHTMQAGPDRGLPLDDLVRALHEHHAARPRSAGHAA